MLSFSLCDQVSSSLSLKCNMDSVSLLMWSRLMFSAAYIDQIWYVPFTYITKQKESLIVLIQLMLSA
jgi:hypothetical protein